MIDYRGQVVDLSSEFTLLTDTSDEEEETRDEETDSGIVDPRIPNTHNGPIIDVVPVNIQVDVDPRQLRKKRYRSHENTQENSKRKMKSLS